MSITMIPFADDPARNFVLKPLQVLSLGAGVQSVAMLIMVELGLLDKPDIIIHSNTGSEMPHTVELLETTLIPYITDVLKIPYIEASSFRGALHDDYHSKSAIPMIGMRSCTLNFKVMPVRREIRKIVGNQRGKVLAIAWLGITTDESKRELKSEMKWIQNKFPLLEADMSRNDCLQLIAAKGWTVEKSGCWLCPYMGVKGFLSLKKNHPDLFAKAVEMEAAMRAKRPQRKQGFLSNNGTWLADADWPTIELKYSSCDDPTGGCFL
jgi:3'-phosphoadenosine 5'-phosphosulfate sulfotransferase (PAPS reductase)/FAD synthetase